MNSRVLGSCLVIAWLGTAVRAAEPLPKVVLVGDSIRLGYAPLVAERLEGKAVVVSPPANGGDSANVLAHLDEWVIRAEARRRPPELRPARPEADRRPTGTIRSSSTAYAENLRRIVARIRDGTDAALVFADTTPILDERHAQRRADFDRTEADVRRYNAAAHRVMRELGVPVHDLHWVVEQGGPETMLGTGRHALHRRRLRSAGRGGRRLRAPPAHDRPLSARCRSRPPGPRPPAAYRKAAGRPRRAGPRALPAAQGRPSSASPRMPPPGRRGGPTCSRSRPRVARRPAAPARRRREPGSSPASSAPGYTLEKVAARQRRGRRGDRPAARPGGPEGAGAGDPLAPLLDPRQDANHHPRDQRRRGAARRGLRAGRLRRARPDAYWHGDRAGTGPSGARGDGPGRAGRPAQAATCGSAAPSGACSSATTRSRSTTSAAGPEVDASRIGATGMSMGSTRAWWLAAVDDRVAAVVGRRLPDPLPEPDRPRRASRSTASTTSSTACSSTSTPRACSP